MTTPTEDQLAYMTAHVNDNRRTGFIIANTVAFSAGSIAFTLRYISRRIGGVSLGVDDWLMAVGMFFTTSYVAMLYLLLHFGMGRHVILAKDPKSLTIVMIAAETTYAASICFIKLSVLGLYNRLFEKVWFQRTNIGVAVFIVLYTVTKIFGDIFQCVPIKSHWDPTVHATCINFSKLVIVHGVLNILTDFVILALPMPILWNLQLNTLKKWALTFMLTVGAFVCIISVVRLPIVKEVDTPDPTWDFVWPFAISSIECCSAVIATCVPTYLPFFSYITGGDPRRQTSARPSQGTPMEPRSSFSNDELPLSSLPHIKTNIYRELGTPPKSEGEYTNVDAETGQIDSNTQQILVTRSFSSKASSLGGGGGGGVGGAFGKRG